MPPSSQNSSAETQSSGPVGEGNYEVKQGECFESIAFEAGFFWQTLWNHLENGEVKEARKNPNILLPGDRIFIPDIRAKEESATTDRRHRFRRKGVPSKLRLVLKDYEGEPRANVQYTLDIDGQLLSGQTDSHGKLECSIPPNSKKGTLTIRTGRRVEEYDVALGNVDPITEMSGIEDRLRNLGFLPSGSEKATEDDLSEAVRFFQAKHGLANPGGEIDDPTRQKLVQEYGS